ncbi:MAG: methyltransferase domain-containing protein [Pseudomonadota bacterium]
MGIRYRVATAIQGLARLVYDPKDGNVADRECPICDYTGEFAPFGLYFRRPDVICPECGAFERQRLLKLCLQQDGMTPGGRCLHFAPETSTRSVVEPYCSDYVTADLQLETVDLNINIEATGLPDEDFDTIICFHVLEHVDHNKALAELYRILRPGGVAYLAVPIVEGLDTTYEDPSITEPSQRLLHFQQTDHTRLFGRDFRGFVRRAGFDLVEFAADPADCARYGLIPGERVFIARKPISP